MEFFIVFVCILLNACLASAEMAFITVRKSQLREVAKAGGKRAAYLLQLRNNPERTLSIIQIGISLVGAIAAAVGGAGAEEMLSPFFERQFQISESTAEAISIGIIVVPLTYFSVIFGELVPKSLALRFPLFIATWASYMFSFLDRFLAPVVTSLEWSTRQILNLIFRKVPSASTTSEADASIELDSLSKAERQYVLNVVDLGRKRLSAIYTPWTEVISVKATQTFEEVEAIILSSGHTRLPVFANENIEGVLNSREFMAFKTTERRDWITLIRPSVNIQEKTPLLQALRILQERKNHMCIVLSDHDSLGIATLEDIIEEVVGEIYDEDDDGTLKRILASAPRRKMR